MTDILTERGNKHTDAHSGEMAIHPARRGLRGNQSRQHLGLGLLVSRTVRS